jgi:hypothetical protein
MGVSLTRSEPYFCSSPRVIWGVRVCLLVVVRGWWQRVFLCARIASHLLVRQKTARGKKQALLPPPKKQRLRAARTL